MLETTANGFDTSIRLLFSKIDDYLVGRKNSGRLDWIDETGWSPAFTESEISSEKFAAALTALGEVVKSALERSSRDVLKFLFDVFADVVRDEGRWRVFLGKYCIVDECLNSIQAVKENFQEGENWIRSALRLLTNCCGDPDEDGSADENRAQIVTKLPVNLVFDLMNASAYRTEAVSLIYNIGSYDENFRAIAISAGVISALWRMLEDFGHSETPDSRLLAPICEMLMWAPEDNNHGAQKTFGILCKLSRHDLTGEDVESMIEVALAELRKQGLPKEQDAFLDLQGFLLSTCFLVPQSQSNASLPESLEERFQGDEEEMLIKPRESLIVELSALSSRPYTALHWSATGLPFVIMLSWIQASHFQIRICALTMLGNSAYQSEALSKSLIEDGLLCDKMNAMLKSETNGLVLKTALGAVQRFARTPHHRVAFGRSGILLVIAASWTQGTNLPLQQAALSATRHLLSGSMENVDKFMSEPAAPQQSLLQLLLKAFRLSEVSETHSDIAWTLERMWRSIYSGPVVREMYEGKERDSKMDPIATKLLEQTIPRVYQSDPKVLEPFLVILKSDNEDQIIAATYTLTIMLNEERDYEAIYDTLCQNEGRTIFLSLLQKTSYPKAQMNSQALTHKLRNHYADDNTRATNLTGLLQASNQDGSRDSPKELRKSNNSFTNNLI